MGWFKKESPLMTELTPTPALLKFDSSRTRADTLRTVLHITNGIYPTVDNGQIPQFKNNEDFEISIREILGSLDIETFHKLIEMLLFDTYYLNRFIVVASETLDNAFLELEMLFGHQIPLSSQTIMNFSNINNEIHFLITELSQVIYDLGSRVDSNSLVKFSSPVVKSKDFSTRYMHELKRSMEYVKGSK